jgi:bacterioferritin
MSTVALDAALSAAVALAPFARSSMKRLTARKSVAPLAAPARCTPRGTRFKLTKYRQHVEMCCQLGQRISVFFASVVAGQSQFSTNASQELVMKGDAKVVEFLNKALRHELTAVNQYWLHYRLLENWGYKDLAKQWRKESIEEMEHADKLVERIIFLDGFPNMQVLDPLHIGQSVKEVLDCDLAAEMSARALYQEAATHCHAAKDYVTRDLFEKLMSDEEHHIDFLETQLDLVAKLGLELYAQHHIGEMGEEGED